MKYLINESNLVSIETRIYKSINKVGLYETLRRYKLPFKLANIIISPENEEYFTCREISQIFYYYLFDTDEIPKEFRYKNFKIITTPEPHSSMVNDFYMDFEVYFYGVTKKYLVGLGQPFYCRSGYGDITTNLEYNFYSEGEYGSMNYLEVDTTSVGKNYWNTLDIKFTTLNQVLTWYTEVYPKIIIEYTNNELNDVDDYLDERLSR